MRSGRRLPLFSRCRLLESWTTHGRMIEYARCERVTSTDGMTADFYPFGMGFLGRAANRIINEVRGINRVLYDVTSKPPGTIEWE